MPILILLVGVKISSVLKIGALLRVKVGARASDMTNWLTKSDTLGPCIGQSDFVGHS